MPGGRKPPTKTTSAAAKHARTPVRVSHSATTATGGAGLSTCADVVCDLCCANIRENEEDAVQCEGACGMWYHRYCIGVSRSQFQKLAGSDTPFVCQYCSMALQAARITQLESLVSSLTGEVSELKAALQATQSTCTSNSDALATITSQVSQVTETTNFMQLQTVTQPWSEVVRNGKAKGNNSIHKEKRGKVHQQCHQKTQKNTEKLEENSSHQSSQKPRHLPSSKMRVQISGARRIWGTLKTTTCAAVSSSLKRLTSFSDQIMVKRKYKTARDNHAVVKKWWFILRGSEERLQQLENEWEPVAIHTSWKIEPAYRFTCDADEQHGPDKECDKVPADNSKNVNSDNEPHNANKVPADNSKNVNSDNEPHNANKVPADNSKNVNSDNESHNANTNLTSESASPPEIMQRSPSNCSSSSFLGHQ